MCDAQEPIKSKNLMDKVGVLIDELIFYRKTSEEAEKHVQDLIRFKAYEHLTPPSPPRPKTVTETFLTYLISLHQEKQIEFQSSKDDNGYLTVVFKRIKR